MNRAQFGLSRPVLRGALPSGRTVGLRAGIFFWVFAVTGLFCPAARAEPLNFNLPAQRADTALLEFSKQANLEILFSSTALRKVNSTAVVGRFEPEEALKELLRDTGFIARRDPRGKFIVTLAPPATGGIRGRLIGADGRGLRGMRVSIAALRQTVVTDEQGEFHFSALPIGFHRIVANGEAYPPLRIATARVEADQVVTLAPKTMVMASEPTRLAPVVVQGRLGQLRAGDRAPGAQFPRSATGNLDLNRGEDDVLPYTVHDREKISRGGVVNLNEFLQRSVLDSDAASRPPEQNGTTESFVAGSTNLSLRGYGADETVVLVNGRRLPEILNSFSSKYSRSQTPDVNFIPLSLVDRVEVLPVSASALYSGNPVGGVINIVLRSDMDATEVTATHTNALAGFDVPQSTISLQHGQTLLGGALRLRFNASFSRAVPATEAELGYRQAYLRANPTAANNSLYRATPNLVSADGTPLFGPGTPRETSVAPGADGNGGLAAFSGRQGVRNGQLFDSVGGFASSPESVDYPYGRRQRGVSYFASAAYDVFPWLEVGIDGIHTRSSVNRGHNVFSADLMLAGTSPFNPFGKDVRVSLNETAPLLGEDYNEARIDFSSAVFGLLVKLPAQWRFSADVQYAHNLTKYRGVSEPNHQRWQQLVDAGRYNPLRDTQVHSPSAEFYDRVLKYYGGRGQFVTLGDYEAIDTAVRISNQTLVLPTGIGAVSVGGDYRRNRLDAYFNSQRYGDGSLVGSPVEWTGRRLERISAFGELQSPLLPEHWLPGWLQRIETDLALRYVAADTSQETNVAPTGGLKVSFTGGLALRATVATSNRFPTPQLSRQMPAPELPNGEGGGEVSLVKIRDPRRGNEEYGVRSSEILTPDLRPEAAVTRTVGLIFQRGEVHRFRTALDYVDTRKSGEQVTTIDEAGFVNLEALFPGRVTRAPVAPADPQQVGKIVSVLTGAVNVAWRQSQNWTTAVDYTWTECRGGRLDAYARWLYFQRYELQLLPTSAVVDELTQPDGAAPGLLKHRVNFGAGWSNRRYGFGLDGRYFHSRVLPMNEWAFQGGREINAHWQFDAYVQSDLARWLPGKESRFELRAQLRVNNIFGAQPPKYAGDVAGTGVQAYGDWRGRVYSVSLTAVF